ncbi:hypothetical protein ECZU34_11930 [Escherichia coli]|nr:hypothetical protein ECZU34_11930 [Escherichia coli]
MRSAQVYRWQIPMDAGVVLRDRRLKPATGCTFACVRASAKGGGSPHCRASAVKREEAQSVLLAG